MVDAMQIRSDETRSEQSPPPHAGIAYASDLRFVLHAEWAGQQTWHCPPRRQGAVGEFRVVAE